MDMVRLLSPGGGVGAAVFAKDKRCGPFPFPTES
jgi:hypothetical protein